MDDNKISHRYNIKIITDEKILESKNLFTKTYSKMKIKKIKNNDPNKNRPKHNLV